MSESILSSYTDDLVVKVMGQTGCTGKVNQVRSGQVSRLPSTRTCSSLGTSRDRSGTATPHPARVRERSKKVALVGLCVRLHRWRKLCSLLFTRLLFCGFD